MVAVAKTGTPPDSRRTSHCSFLTQLACTLPLLADASEPVPLMRCRGLAPRAGSGKTLGFLLPALHRIAIGDFPKNAAGPSVLVMAPTRELVQQIAAECVKFDQAAGAGSVCIFGGVPKGPQEAALKKKPQIIIATPGRMVDLMDMGVAHIKAVRYLVLDEVSACLPLGKRGL
jgi:superfamily II DNA/RNA helicase